MFQFVPFSTYLKCFTDVTFLPFDTIIVTPYLSRHFPPKKSIQSQGKELILVMSERVYFILHFQLVHCLVRGEVHEITVSLQELWLFNALIAVLRFLIVDPYNAVVTV